MIKKVQNWIIDHLPKSLFVQNVMVLMSGNLIVQVFAVGASLVLARLYTPADFGVFTIFLSITGVMSVIVCGRYEQAIVLPEKDEDASNLAALCILISFGLATLVLPIIFLFRHSIAHWFDTPLVAPLLWFLPISLISAGVYQTLDYWNSRRGKFKRMAARQVSQTTVALGTQLGLGFAGAFGAIGLIGGSILGQLTATVHLAFQTLREEFGIVWKEVSLTRMRVQLIRYVRFPLYSSWADLLNTASSMVPPLLLGYYFSAAVVGYYGWGQRLLAVPLSTIGISLSHVFFPRAAEARREGNLNDVTLRVFTGLLETGLTPFLLLMLVAPELFSYLFGIDWLNAGHYARWLCPWMLFQFVSSPISTLYLVMEKQKPFLVFNISLFLFRISAVIIGGHFGSPMLAVILLGIYGMVLYMANTLYLLRLTGIGLFIIIDSLKSSIMRSIPFLILPVILRLNGNDPLELLTTTLIIGFMFFLIQYKWLRHRLLSG